MQGDKPETYIKVCGITRESDAELLLKFGVNALGINFFAASPRFVSIQKASQICHVINDKAVKVGLFVNAEADYVKEVLASVPLNILQFHGDESAAYCEQFGHPYWKALRVKNADKVVQQIQDHANAEAILLDAWHPDQYGGTGETFDWGLISGLANKYKLLLAGGLNPDNVAQAIRQVKPWGVDVSSGVEESPGIKSELLINNFIEEVRSV